MSLYVMKFGGTSLACISCIKRAAELVGTQIDAKHGVVVVVSAMAKETERLLRLGCALGAAYNGVSEMDALLACGEQASAALFSMALQQEGYASISMNGRQAGIYTDDTPNKARIVRIDPHKIQKELSSGTTVVVTGFQGVDSHERITTLGRGGSDTSAVALAIALQARECRIYTDVDGIHTTDPRLEPAACLLPTITFEEMLEMASLGSKVLQSRAVELAGKHKMPLRVLSTFSGNPGTLIIYQEPRMEHAKISGIAFSQDEAQITVRGIPDRPGIAAALLQPVAEHNIEIDMIVQNAGHQNGLADFSFTVHRRDYRRVKEIMDDTVKKLGGRAVRGNENIVKVSVVGVGMRSHAGVAAKMFTTLAENKIDIRMISTSEIKISVILSEKDLHGAVSTLHKAFSLDKT